MTELPRIVVDLERPPSERWDGLRPHQAAIRELVDVYPRDLGGLGELQELIGLVALGSVWSLPRRLLADVEGYEAVVVTSLFTDSRAPASSNVPCARHRARARTARCVLTNAAQPSAADKENGSPFEIRDALLKSLAERYRRAEQTTRPVVCSSLVASTCSASE